MPNDPAVPMQGTMMNQEIPLRQTLNKIGITKPNEQQLIAEYAGPYGRVDEQSGDIMIKRNMAQALWNNVSQDRDFNNKLDAMRVDNMTTGLQQVRTALYNPQVVNSMTQQEKDFYTQYLPQLEQQRQQIHKRTMLSQAVAQGQLSLEQAEALYAGNPMRNPIDESGEVPNPMAKPEGSEVPDTLMSKLTFGGIL